MPDSAARGSLKTLIKFFGSSESGKLAQERAFYDFDRYRLDLGQRVLLRDGELIPLAPKALDCFWLS